MKHLSLLPNYTKILSKAALYHSVLLKLLLFGDVVQLSHFLTADTLLYNICGRSTSGICLLPTLT